MKKRLTQKVLQFIANYVIYMLENSQSLDMFIFYFELGLKLDTYAIVEHEIYLE